MKYILFLTALLSIVSNASVAGKLDTQASLRTLFTTNQERSQLDHLRQQGKFDKIKNESSTVIFREPAVVKMQGVVIRKDKDPVVFVNNENTLKSPQVNDKVYVNTARVKKQEYQVPARIYGQNIKLKPGQQWSEKTQLVEENYQIKPPKAKTSDNDNILDKVDNLTNLSP
ncbi:MAG: hypothetical protein OQK46_04260 [Gammaproteobacteria bacterium]|nr:hypothetical protein [Gammaproteobacteria bacterium]